MPRFTFYCFFTDPFIIYFIDLLTHLSWLSLVKLLQKLAKSLYMSIAVNPTTKNLRELTAATTISVPLPQVKVKPCPSVPFAVFITT